MASPKTSNGTLPAAERVAIYVDGVLDARLPETSATLTPYASGLALGCLPEEPQATMPQMAFGGEIDMRR